MPFNAEDFKDDDGFNEFIKGKVDESIATAVAGFEANTTKLKNELKKAKANQSALDADELAALHAKAKKLDDLDSKNLEDKGEYEKLIEKTKSQHKLALDDLTASLDKERLTTRKLLVDGGLSTALAAANTNPALLTAAVKLLSDEVTVIEEDGIYVARVGEKTVVEYVGDWAKGDVGKNFVLAPGNSGGGGKPTGDVHGGDDVSKFFDPKSDSYNVTEQFKLRTSDKAAYDGMIAKYGNANAPGTQRTPEPVPMVNGGRR